MVGSATDDGNVLCSLYFLEKLIALLVDDQAHGDDLDSLLDCPAYGL